MAKATTTPVETKTITLTTEQYEVLFKVRLLLDNASDRLDNIDGDENAFTIGKQVGDVIGDIITAFNDLGDLIDATNPNDVSNEWEVEMN
jgi:hypothetical protein